MQGSGIISCRERKNIWEDEYHVEGRLHPSCDHHRSDPSCLILDACSIDCLRAKQSAWAAFMASGGEQWPFFWPVGSKGSPGSSAERDPTLCFCTQVRHWIRGVKLKFGRIRRFIYLFILNWASCCGIHFTQPVGCARWNAVPRFGAFITG